ncbi:DUF3325 domain-containing protein [Luteimonas sp. SX5]|uniref:DUF3325 domain-containing protein n=1 Tax=Luteimonas galliterrae TaxID=2940486 RepID=A0ABT0MHA4_9GAMM|nr:DUF3325 domain-containing protein [Luteimonas galliterrae]MCL1634248.1 DUF3325 domain-containing protein [Luteimonas galliterrae]
MTPWLLVAGLTISGWAALSHALPRHHQEAFGSAGSPLRRSLHRIAGSIGLLLAFVVSIASLGWEFGPVLWSVLLCAGAIVWVLCRNADPRGARWLGWLAPLPGLILLWV